MNKQLPPHKVPASTPFYLLLQSKAAASPCGSLWGPASAGKGKLSVLGGRCQGQGLLERTPELWQVQLPEQGQWKARALLPMYRWSSLGSSRTYWHSHMEQAGNTEQGRGREGNDMSRGEAAATGLHLPPEGLCFPLAFLVSMKGTGKKTVCAIQMAIWKINTF